MFIDKNIEAEKIKKNLKSKSIKKTPVSGIFRIERNNISFDMLVINSDDTSISERFWDDNYYDFTLDKWCDWSKEEGVYIDVGAHTGLYTVAALVSNNKNHLISIEPFTLNYHRIITNLRLNNFNNKNASLFNLAVSDNDKIVKFDIKTSQYWSYLSKGGKIGNEGVNTKAIKLDSLKFSNNKINLSGLKIDTEGEDLNVIFGAEKMIENFMPKIIIECRKHNILDILKYLSKFGYNNIYDQYGNSPGSKKLIEFNEGENSKDLFFEKN